MWEHPYIALLIYVDKYFWPKCASHGIVLLCIHVIVSPIDQFREWLGANKHDIVVSFIQNGDSKKKKKNIGEMSAWRLLWRRDPINRKQSMFCRWIILFLNQSHLFDFSAIFYSRSMEKSLTPLRRTLRTFWNYSLRISKTIIFISVILYHSLIF